MLKEQERAKGMSQLELALSIGHTTSGFLGKAEIGIDTSEFFKDLQQ